MHSQINQGQLDDGELLHEHKPPLATLVPFDVMEQRVGKLEPMQIKIWRQMTPAQRLDIAFQAYQFVLDVVRLTERQRHPNLSEQELAWRVARRIQGNLKLGKVTNESSKRS